MTQSVIVYSNPLQQMFWESSIPLALCIGLVVFFAAIMLGEKIILRYAPLDKHEHDRWVGVGFWASAGIAMLAFLLTIATF